MKIMKKTRGIKFVREKIITHSNDTTNTKRVALVLRAGLKRFMRISKRMTR